MNVLRDGEIWLHGTVGDGFFRQGFTAADVAEALSSIGRSKPVTIHLNSGGGIASEGAAIYAVLDQHPAPKKIIVEGVAASAASLLAMAGEVTMKKGAIMMIHDPSGITAGTSKDHQKTTEALEALANSMAEIYAEKSGKTVEEARDDMREEIWLTASAAKEQGYADRIDSGKSKPIAAFDYRLYANAPDRFTAMAKANDWDMDGDGKADRAADYEEEDIMSETAKKGGTETKSVATDSPEFKAAVAAAVTEALKAESDKAAKEAADKEAAEAVKKGQETAEQMTARIRQEEQKRMADITAACAMAGKSELAAKFISENKSLSDVVAALQDERAKGGGSNDKGKGQQTATQELNNHRGGQQTAAGGDFDASAAWKRQTDKINARTNRFMANRQTA